MTALLPALAGANLIYGLGMLELGVTFSFSQLMIDAEIARMVKRVVQGVEVSDATLGVDVIKAVGPGNDFLIQKHTMDFMKSEQSRAKVFDRRMRNNWELRGSKDASETAAEMAREILATHKPEPLETSVKNEIRRIVESAE
ncbi:MAG: trimethylamine methyltransferase family protein [Clostridia bacterium]|nr:trimethylamine methyltransferase family protein [Clostridia bacterium]